MELSGATTAAILQTIGAAVLTYLGYGFIKTASFWLLPSLPLTKYKRHLGSWALITGSSAGIGLACAQELAARGFSIVLLGHKPEELSEARDIIISEYPLSDIKIILLDAAKSTPAEIASALSAISSLTLTILVNNVGGNRIAPPTIRPLIDYDSADIDAVVDLNARFMAHVTRLLLPQLAANGPSLVLNVSSGSHIGMPRVAVYAACKAFVLALSKALAREMKLSKLPVDVLAIIPGDVITQAQTREMAPGAPTQREFTRAMLDRVPRAVRRGRLELAPWWSHAVQFAAGAWVPEWLLLMKLKQLFDIKLEAVLAADKEK